MSGVDPFGGDIGLWPVAFVLGAAFVTGAFHTFAGFAGGTLLALLIAPVLGVEAVVPVLAVALSISATSRVWAFRRDIDWPVVLNIVLPALPCIAAGAVIYTALSPAAISIVLGAFLVATTLWRRLASGRKREVGRPALALVGMAFGLLSGVTIGGGMILVPFLLGKGLVRERFAAAFAAIGFSLNATKSATFLATQTLDARLAAIGLAAGLCTIPGTYLGLALLRRTAIRAHIRLVDALVLAGGLIFLWYGMRLAW